MTHQDNQIRLLLVGDWHSALHEEPLAEALRSVGAEVHEFKWHSYFDGGSRSRRFFSRLQNRALLGPTFQRLNRDLVMRVAKVEPDVVLIYRGTHIHMTTMRKLQNAPQRPVLAGYNNDDAFAPKQSEYQWRHFKRTLGSFDIQLVYRERELRQYLHHGARRTALLRSWFNPAIHWHGDRDYKSWGRRPRDVIFIGHYEDDGRLEAIRQLVKRNVDVQIFGPSEGWSHALQSRDLRHLLPVVPLWGDAYGEALRRSKIGLCFFSRLNRDEYTRRVFEIPACGAALIAPQTDEMDSLFTEGRDYLGFNSSDELVNRVERCLQEPELLFEVARSGAERVWKDGHSVRDRALELLSTLEKIRLEPS